MFFWGEFISFLQKCFEWLIEKKIINKHIENLEESEQYLNKLLKYYWTGRLSQDYLVYSINEPVIPFEYEKLEVLGDLCVFTNNWDLCEVVANRIHQFAIKNNYDFYNINSSKSRIYKYKAFKCLYYKQYKDAAIEFQKCSLVWDDISKSFPNLIGFYYYYDGLYNFFLSLHMMSTEKNYKKSIKLNNIALNSFLKAKIEKGSGNKEFFIEITQIYHFIIKYLSTSENNIKSYLASMSILLNYKKMKIKINNNQNKLVEEYNDLIGKPTEIGNSKIDEFKMVSTLLLYSQGIISSEQKSTIDFINELCSSKKILVKMIIKVLSLLLLPTSTIICSILSLVYPGMLMNALTVLLIIIAALVIVANKL